jgi:hypothetical protein
MTLDFSTPSAISARHAVDMIREASGTLQTAAVRLEEEMHELTPQERADLAAELELMRVFMRNLEACAHFERHCSGC